MRDIRKFLISIIQDYCNNRGYKFESEKFALAFGAQCAEMLQLGTLSVDSIKQALKDYPTFVKGNDLSYETFAIELTQEICDNNEYIPAKPDFHTAIINFKRYFEGNLYPAFQVVDNPQEEIGRTLLQAYLRPRGFREAQMAGGNSDLIYPSEEIIVETKIWRDIERYKDGIVELSAYLDSQGYSVGYYVLFDNTQVENSVVSKQGSQIFDLHEGTYLIHFSLLK